MRNVKTMNRPRYLAEGGNMTDLIGMLSSVIDATNTSDSGKVDTAGSFLSGALKGGGVGSTFGPIGTIVGGIGGGLVSSLQAKKSNKLIDNKTDAEALAYKTAEQNRMSNAVRLANQNSGISSYYARGGVMQPVAPNVDMAVGPKHSEGGMNIAAPDGSTANIEGGEVVKDNNLVFSDQLQLPDGSGKTFAQAAKEIADSNGYKVLLGKREVANKINDNPRGNQFAKNAAKRTLEKEPDLLDNLFKIQEMLKQQQQQQVDTKIQQEQTNAQGQNPDATMDVQGNHGPDSDNDADGMIPPQMGIGGDMLDVANKAGKKIKDFDWATAAPYIDNVVNARLNNKAPAIPTPT